MTFPRFVIEQSDQEFYTSQSGMALVGLAMNRFTSLVPRVTKAAPSRGIATADVLRSYIGLLCQGKSDFEAIRPFCVHDIFFNAALRLQKVPSAETLRQRLDQFAEILRAIVDYCTIELLKKAVVTLSTLLSGVQRLCPHRGLTGTGGLEDWRTGGLVPENRAAPQVPTYPGRLHSFCIAGLAQEPGVDGGTFAGSLG